jgi:pimeloyl-ACP methyl ester carboxylesterase
LPRQSYMQACTRQLSKSALDWHGAWTQIGDEQIHFVEAGQGEPLLLIHGFFVWSYFWRKVLPGLSRFARVFAPDLRGFGLTERLPDQPLHLWAQAELIVRLMDHLGLERAVLCGHSMGGEVALRVALRYPERVRGLVLASSAGYVRRESTGWERRLLAAPLLGRLMIRLLVANQRFAGRAMRDAYHDGKIDPTDLRAYLLPGYLPRASRTMARMLREIDFGATAGAIKEVTHPTLLVWGKEDPWIPLTHGQRLAETLPQNRLVIFPNCGHSPPEEHPEAFTAAILSFWRELGLLDPLADPKGPSATGERLQGEDLVSVEFNGLRDVAGGRLPIQEDPQDLADRHLLQGDLRLGEGDGADVPKQV